MTSTTVSDVLVVVHVLWAAFMIGGFLLGAAAIWRHSWRRWLVFRTVHIIGIVFTASVPLWAGICPVTTWENALRLRTGADAIPHSFVAYYAHRILYLDVPAWAITGCTTLVAIGSVALFFIFPPWKKPGQA